MLKYKNVYTLSSREIRRIDGITKSPVNELLSSNIKVIMFLSHKMKYLNNELNKRDCQILEHLDYKINLMRNSYIALIRMVHGGFPSNLPSDGLISDWTSYALQC